ncbi:DinB family protein [Cohnella pontilimi]|uniref:DinB family protein n=1 Tax=Cohnella pontilimi TaxID=2564100 RepID=A0A4U0FFV4_9BACL|nr:DinB family protein [Cohnella pontilimi]TJY43853.1 DinB family protein [Cohnella pontilimi]
MNYKSILLDQLNACYNDKSWFIPLQEILIDLNAAQAAWENESKQSIWSIVNHLNFWNEKWLERYNLEQFESKSSINNDDTFYVNPHSINDIEWKKTLQRLETVFKSWNRALEESEDHKLITEIPSYFNAPWWGVVSNLCIHNAYHIGQIMLLKKQLLSLSQKTD